MIWRRFRRIGSSSNPLKIVAIGNRQSGKTTLISVAYHDSEENRGHTIKPADDKTIERTRKKYKELKENIIKPTPIGVINKYAFEFLKNGRENSHQLHFTWTDIAGEYFDLDKDRTADCDDYAVVEKHIEASDGCCVIIDSENLMKDKDPRAAIRHIGNYLSSARKKHRQMTFNRHKYPIAIVYTKTDTLRNDFDADRQFHPSQTYLHPVKWLIQMARDRKKSAHLRRQLNSKARTFITQVSGGAYAKKIFTSEFTRSGDIIESKGQLKAMIWLIKRSKKNCGFVAALKSLILHPIISLTKE